MLAGNRERKDKIPQQKNLCKHGSQNPNMAMKPKQLESQAHCSFYLHVNVASNHPFDNMQCHVCPALNPCPGVISTYFCS